MSDELKKKVMEQLEHAVVFGQRCMVDTDATSFAVLEYQRFLAYAVTVVAEITGEQSGFSKQIGEIRGYNWHSSVKAEGIVGVVQAVKAAIDSGLLEGYRKLIRGELFSDYLDMARHLLDEGYKDAAAVIAGSSMEVTLRSLCIRHDIPTSDQKNGKEIPKKSESLNTELRKHGYYDKTEQKLVTAWLGIRNDAAHGNYSNYSLDMVKAMLIGLRGFISSHT